jgi:hypothetical protein
MMGKMKNVQIDMEALAKFRSENPPRMGEVFDDGQFRGHLAPDVAPPPVSIRIGDYLLWDSGGNFYIVFVPTGQMGTFKKEHFESHVPAFFGLHF